MIKSCISYNRLEVRYLLAWLVIKRERRQSRVSPGFVITETKTFQRNRTTLQQWTASFQETDMSRV